jgi:iron(III) transport system ATP-binding protein
VYENIAYPLRSYREEDQRIHTDQLLKVLMLGSHKDHYPKELSGGQKQRVAIARALADEPKLLLMDEPFSNMDVALKEVVKSSVFDYLKQQRITAILVTHDPKDALATSDQIAVLKSGSIVQLSTPKVIFEKPNDKYVMSCLGHCNYWTKQAYEIDFGQSLENDTNSAGIRVSDLFAVGNYKTKIDVVVLANVYQGENYLIKGECKSRTICYFFSQTQIPCGNRIALVIDNSKIVYFE